MNGHVIPGTPFAVDFWKIRECPTIKLFFLTHLHGDHTVGLSSSWQHPIYCSPVTGEMLLGIYGIQEDLVRPLEVGSSHIIPLDDVEEETMTVHVLDANHCPGSVMFIFQGYFGKIFHTGDFRYHKDMISASNSHLFSDVDRLYLDNTYCDVRCVFPPRQEVISSIVKFIKSKPSYYNFVIGMRKLGKEDLLVSIAEQCNEYISVPADMYNRILYLGLPDVFLCDEENCRIRTVNFHYVSKKNLEKWNTIQPTIAILPTGLYIGQDVHPFCKVDNIHVFPFSDHSSYTELMEFVDKVKPRKIVPIVSSESRGPFGLSLSSRADMSCFSHTLNNDQMGILEQVRIPPVGKWMKKRNSQNVESKARKGKHSKQSLRKKSSLRIKGVVFDSDSNFNSQSNKPSRLIQYVNDIQRCKKVEPDRVYDFSYEENSSCNGRNLQQKNLGKRSSLRSSAITSLSAVIENKSGDSVTEGSRLSSQSRDSRVGLNIPKKDKTADVSSDVKTSQTGAELREVNISTIDSGSLTAQLKPSSLSCQASNSVYKLSVISGNKVVDVSSILPKTPPRYRMVADDLISENSADSDTAFQKINLSRKKKLLHSSPLLRDVTSDLLKKKLDNELVDLKAVDKSSSIEVACDRSNVKVLMDVSDLDVGFVSSEFSSQCKTDVNSNKKSPIISEFKQEFLNFLHSKNSPGNTNNDTVVISSSEDDDRMAEQSKYSNKRSKRRRTSYNCKEHGSVTNHGKISRRNATDIDPDRNIPQETDQELDTYEKGKPGRANFISSHTKSVKNSEHLMNNSTSSPSGLEIINNNLDHVGSKQIISEGSPSQAKARSNKKVPLQRQRKHPQYRQLRLNMVNNFSQQNKVTTQVDTTAKSLTAHTNNELLTNKSRAASSHHKSLTVSSDCKKRSYTCKTWSKTRTSLQNLSIQKNQSSCKEGDELFPPEQKKMKAIVDFVCSEPFFSVKPLRFRNTNKNTLKQLDSNRNTSANLNLSNIEKELSTKRKQEKDVPFVWDVV